jgi:glutaconate CoA-transferase subunit B
VLGYHPQSNRMQVLALQPGASLETVIANTGFELSVADRLELAAPPSDDELRILRDEIDKDRFYI